MSKPDQAPKRPAQATVQEAQTRMQVEFARTGTFRTEDVNRVLGDPREGVSCVVPEAAPDSLRRTSRQVHRE